MPRFAANLGYLFTEHDFLDRFQAAGNAGLRGVEFAQPYQWPAAEIRARLDAHGLECVLANLPMGDRARGDFGIACRPGREAEFREGVALGIGYAHALGAPKLNCITGTAAPGEDSGALRRTLISNLRYAAREFKTAGLDLVVEPINTTDVPGFFLPRCPEAVDVIAEVGEPNLFLQCDLYHAAMMGDDPAAILERCWDAIGHIQFADAPGRHEPGSGTIDFAPLFARIDARGYAGWVSAEYRPTRRTEHTLSSFLPA
ncbi:MAG TPA: TIM barrel protein [Usitatibacter sp.]|jgi:hydroxypyruvate isomerase|nr:TIM barrel protein [Usitatibacter sp.]